MLSRTGITLEQKLKYKEQHSQYQDAKSKLESQLLKLKEQRESFKEEGAKHEDAIMKENARLQVRHGESSVKPAHSLTILVYCRRKSRQGFNR